MSSKPKADMFRTLKFRLTFWFSLLFALLSLSGFIFTYLRLEANLTRRIDDQLAADGQEMSILLRGKGVAEVKKEIFEEGEEDGVGNVFFRLYSRQQGIIATSDLSDWKGLNGPPALPEQEVQKVFQTLSIPGKNHQVRSLTLQLDKDHYLQIGVLLREDEHLLGNMRQSFATAFLIMLPFGGLVAFFMAWRAMSGLERIRKTADRISQGDFSQTVPLGQEGEEIESLARTFNCMQEQLGLLIRELHEVTNNIAHDLRSPITRMRGLAETSLTGSQDLAEYQEMACAVIEESDNLVGMINTMLDIAETDAGLRQIARHPVEMDKILRDVVELFQPVAEERSILLRLTPADTPLIVLGDLKRLQRAMANLVDNAIKYTLPGGRVDLEGQVMDGEVIISITDSGIGISSQNLPNIFDRFFRADASRSQSGSGLGLSLVQTIVHAHQGRVEVESALNKGSTFRVVLPRAVF